MVVSDWITLCAVLIALLLGVLSIRETRNIQKASYRNKLLDDIISWAYDIAYERRGVSESTWDTEKLEESWGLRWVRIATESEIALERLIDRGIYISEISHKLDDSLGSMANRIIDNLKERCKLFIESKKYEKEPPPKNEMEKVLDAFSGKEVKGLEKLSEQAKHALALGSNQHILGNNLEEFITRASEIKKRQVK